MKKVVLSVFLNNNALSHEFYLAYFSICTYLVCTPKVTCKPFGLVSKK